MSAEETIVEKLQNEMAELRDRLDKAEQMIRERRLEVESVRHYVVELDSRLSTVESKQKK